MEVDTGATESVMSEGDYREKFNNLDLVKSHNNLCTVTSSRIKEIGAVKIQVAFGGREHQLHLIIIAGVKPYKCIMGRSWIDNLHPDRRSVQVLIQ